MTRNEFRAAVKIEQAIRLVESVQEDHSSGVVRLDKAIRFETVKVRERLRKILRAIDHSERKENLVHYAVRGLTVCGVRLYVLPAGDTWLMPGSPFPAGVKSCNECNSAYAPQPGEFNV